MVVKTLKKNKNIGKKSKKVMMGGWFKSKTKIKKYKPPTSTPESKKHNVEQLQKFENQKRIDSEILKQSLQNNKKFAFNEDEIKKKYNDSTTSNLTSRLKNLTNESIRKQLYEDNKETLEFEKNYEPNLDKPIIPSNQTNINLLSKISNLKKLIKQKENSKAKYSQMVSNSNARSKLLKIAKA
jgi:hypothetical protein